MAGSLAMFFFFQAEDGIRDKLVIGVQTCALPIYLNLYKTSGHYPYYKDSQYAPIQVDDEEFLLKPMNCPHHIMIYKSEMRSYRDLPVRYAEFGTVYSYEQAGGHGGL